MTYENKRIAQLKKENNKSLDDGVTHKIIVVGQAKAGKTSLVNRYKWDKFSDKYSPSLGLSFNGKEIVSHGQLQLFTEAQNSKFVESYYKSAKAFLLCYDVTNQQSFDFLHDKIVTIKEKNPDAHIVLVGNKADGEVKVNDDDVAMFIIEHGINEEHHIITSAKNNAGVSDVFTLVEKLVTAKAPNIAVEPVVDDKTNNQSPVIKSKIAPSNSSFFKPAPVQPASESTLLSCSARVFTSSSVAFLFAASITYFIPGMQGVSLYLAATGAALLGISFMLHALDSCTAGKQAVNSEISAHSIPNVL